MSHDDFLLGYRNGRLGCSVSVLLTLRLFLAGRIRREQVVTTLLGWSLGFLPLIGISVIAFVYLPIVWAFLSAGLLLAVFALGFAHGVAGLVVSTALTDQNFYEFMLGEHALWISVDSEGNLPELQKVVPLRNARRAQR
jgi:hypothetical protein